MRRGGWVPALLLAVGAVLVADAVLRGAASVALVTIIPVISGSSGEFLVGVVLLLVGFLTLPLAFLAYEESSPSTPPSYTTSRGAAPTQEVGGLILVGPVPVFFGSWKDVSLRAKIATAVVGALLLVAFVLAVVVR